ncbi:MAG: hypothetical protein QG622_50 [Actinomycetota bacterium]|nr:hypothetical protein [Actinomycetota bacterium]
MPDTASDGGGVSPTEKAQINLILSSLSAARVYPVDWETAPGGAQYLYRERCVIVRDRYVKDLSPAPSPEEVASRFGSPLPGVKITTVVTGMARVTWERTVPGQSDGSPDEGPSVQEVLASIEKTARKKVAAPDHLLYVCPHSCAATEPEVVAWDADPVPWPHGHNLDHGSPDDVGARSGGGGGVRVLVADTGLVPNAAADHWWLRGVTGEPERPPGGTQLAQDAGHGTFTAGCVRVAALDADVHVLDATAAGAPDGVDPIGAVFESDLAQLLRSQLVADWDPDGNDPVPATLVPRPVPDILLVNFAGLTWDGGPPPALAALYGHLLQHLKELLIIAPAGNEGDTRKNWPASFSWVVSVGALDPAWGRRAPWSNHGRTVDVFAPGDRLVNAYATGTYTCTWEPHPGEIREFRGMARWSGTSFATPLVAGMIATRMSQTGQSSRRAWRSLLDEAEEQAIPGVGPVLLPPR